MKSTTMASEREAQSKKGNFAERVGETEEVGCVCGGVGGVGVSELPSVVGIWIFSGTTHCLCE